MSIFSSLSALTKAMSPGLDLVQSIFSSLSRLTTLLLTCLKLITVWHHDLSQPVQASFSLSEEVFYRSHITILVATIFINEYLVVVLIYTHLISGMIHHQTNETVKMYKTDGSRSMALLCDYIISGYYLHQRIFGCCSHVYSFNFRYDTSPDKWDF